MTSPSFQVGQLTPTLVFSPSPNSQSYGTAIAAGSLNATASYNSQPVQGTFAYSTTINGVANSPLTASTVLPAGNYTLAASFTPTGASAGLYVSGGSIAAAYTVNQAAQLNLTVTGPQSLTYGTTATVTATGGSGTGALSFSVGTSTGCALSGTTLSVINASGTCSLTATKLADSDYNQATSAAFPVSLVKANQAALAVTGPSSLTYGTTTTVTASGGSGTGALSFSAGTSTGCALSGTTLSVMNASGTCSLIATKLADSNYNQATSAAFSVSLVKGSPTVTFTNAPTSAAYNSTFPVATTTTDTGNTPTITGTAGVCTVSGNTVTMISGTGACTLTATWAADNNYDGAALHQYATATKIAPTVTFTGAPSSAAYGTTFPVATTTTDTGNTPTITGTAGVCTVSGNTVTMISGTGTCSLTATWAADNNYNGASLPQTAPMHRRLRKPSPSTPPRPRAPSISRASR